MVLNEIAVRIKRGCAGNGLLYYLRLSFVLNLVVFNEKGIKRGCELY